MDSLKEGQRHAFEVMKSGCHVFLSGAAGTGKSYVVKRFLESVSEKNVLITAPTGIAALNIGGATMHRVFQIPFGPVLQEPAKVSEKIINADIILIDEISMCRADVFDYVAKQIQMAQQSKLREQPDPIQLIVVGDFCQLPPVVTEADGNELIKKYGILDGYYAFQAHTWNTFQFKNVLLTEIVRQKKEELEFIQNLNLIRSGDPAGIEFFHTHTAKRKLKQAIFLCGTNKKVQEVNQKNLNALSGSLHTFQAVYSGDAKSTDYPGEDRLQLKVGCQIMLLANDPDGAYCNGTFAEISDITKQALYVTVPGQDEEIEIAKYTWEILSYTAEKQKDGTYQVKQCPVGTIEQFPVRLAYATTIHKSQGRTFERLNVSPVSFASGQLYVGLSRAISAKKLHLTAKITEDDVFLSPAVKQFYEEMEPASKEPETSSDCPQPPVSPPKKRHSKVSKKEPNINPHISQTPSKAVIHAAETPSKSPVSLSEALQVLADLKKFF